MKLGFIGLGNMASAIIGGILKEGLAKPEEISGSSKTEQTAAKKAGEFGIKTCTDNKKVAQEAEVLVLAVKPQFFSEVIAEIRGDVKEDTLLISIAAGKTMRYIEEQFCMENTIADTECCIGTNVSETEKCGEYSGENGGEESGITIKPCVKPQKKQQIKLVRCMPNTPALVLAGCTGYCVNGRVNEEEKVFAHQLFSSFGKAIEIPERLMDAVGSVGGSSPAFVFMFIEALADGAVAEGMPRAQALEVAAQAVLGSAKLVLESGLHPGALKDMVCSPGGSTIQGVRVLENAGMRGAVMDAVIACAEKSKVL